MRRPLESCLPRLDHAVDPPHAPTARTISAAADATAATTPVRMGVTSEPGVNVTFPLPSVLTMA